MQTIKVRVYCTHDKAVKPAVFDGHIEFDGTPDDLERAKRAIVNDACTALKDEGKHVIRSLISLNPGV